MIDQGQKTPSGPARSHRLNFRKYVLPKVFNNAVAVLNCIDGDKTWLTDKQLQDLHDQKARQPYRTQLEANEAIQKLLFKAKGDVNELTGEQDPVVKLIDLATPENSHFLAINQFRIETPVATRNSSFRILSFSSTACLTRDISQKSPWVASGS